MSTIAITRLAEERKAFRKNHSFGYVAKPTKNADGTLDMMVWECRIPGKKQTDWQGGSYTVMMTFPTDYPTKPPTVAFTPPLFHPNVYKSGKICLSILSQHWKAEFTVHQLLSGIREQLEEVNIHDPAQHEAYRLYIDNRPAYDNRVRAQAFAQRPSYD